MGKKSLPTDLNKLFVAYKPSGMSSNQFLSRLKRKYKTKKAGYSGTLDPFAKGVLIVALGTHTKLFRFLDKAPKTYRATLWLGALSDTLDIEGIKSETIHQVDSYTNSQIEEVIKSLEGSLTYDPPIFSAKSVDGQRAYELARAGKEVKLQQITSTIYETNLIHYMHPFVTFEATVSEGTYIRSLGNLIAKKLGLDGGSLTALERLSEGKFRYNGEKSCDIKNSITPKEIKFLGDYKKLAFGQALSIDDLDSSEDGIYYIDAHEATPDTISIIQIENKKVNYLLNKVTLC